MSVTLIAGVYGMILCSCQSEIAFRLRYALLSIVVGVALYVYLKKVKWI